MDAPESTDPMDSGESTDPLDPLPKPRWVNGLAGLCFDFIALRSSQSPAPPYRNVLRSRMRRATRALQCCLRGRYLASARTTGCGIRCGGPSRRLKQRSEAVAARPPQPTTAAAADADVALKQAQ